MIDQMVLYSSGPITANELTYIDFTSVEEPFQRWNWKTSTEVSILIKLDSVIAGNNAIINFPHLKDGISFVETLGPVMGLPHEPLSSTSGPRTSGMLPSSEFPEAQTSQS